MRQDAGETTQTRAMRAERDRFVALAFCWADFLVETDTNQSIVFSVGATEAILGVPAAQLVGRPLASLIAESDRALATQLLMVAERRGRIENVTIRLHGQRGTTPPLSLAGYCLSDLGSHFFLAFRLNNAMTARTKNGERAPRDLESGLLDGAGFSDIASARIKALRDAGQSAQVSLFALKGLEELRERLSPDAQENLIRAVGATLRASSTGGDSAALIGEGRFSLVHEGGLNTSDLERQIQDFARETDPLGRGVNIESATIDIDDVSISEGDLANSLLYTFNRFRESKGGAFSLKSLSTNISNLMSDAVTAVNSFRKTVASGEFDIAFQPIVNVASGEIHHFEGLCRFRGGDASPYQQITFAEETGLIWQFDLAMAKKVIDWMGSSEAAKRASIAVNLSGHSVGTFTYVDELHKLLRQNMWTRGKLLFEITESARMTDLESANRFIQSLRNEGYEVCLDDFGAGAASFQYLSTLDVDVVKLDGSAIRNAQQAAKGEAFLTALARLCNSLEVETIAEMVDTARGLEFVRKCGVQYVQGYLFGKPSKKIEDFDPLPQGQLFGQSPRRSNPRRS